MGRTGSDPRGRRGSIAIPQASVSVSYTPQFSNNLQNFTNNDNRASPLIKVGNSPLDAANYEVMKVLFPSGTKFGRVQINGVP